MKRKPLPPPLPPLSPEALDSVQRIEDYARHALYNCGDTRYYNAEKALRILRTCVVQSLDVQLDFYELHQGYCQTWVAEIKQITISVMMGLVGLNGAQHWDDIHEEVRSTVNDHLKARVKESTKKSVAVVATISRKQLRENYEAIFPGVAVLDICWAAAQHYTEWKRWLRDAVKDGSAPDRAFRALLTSGKAPAEYRMQPRPHGWK